MSAYLGPEWKNTAFKCWGSYCSGRAKIYPTGTDDPTICKRCGHVVQPHEFLRRAAPQLLQLVSKLKNRVAELEKK